MLPFLYDFNYISSLEILSFIDFSTFTEFEKLISTIGYNILFYLFLVFFCSVVYKTICRIWNYIF